MLGSTALVVVLAVVPAANLVRLDGFEDRAVLIPNRGPGGEVFRLAIRAAWGKSAGRDPGRFALRMTLPDGSTSRQPLAAGEGPTSRTITALIPSGGIKNLRPDAVLVRLAVVEASSGEATSNTLTARIEDFPNPGSGEADAERGPFGWGRPLEITPPGAAVLPNPGPDGLEFARIAPGNGLSGFFLSTTECSVGQIKARIPAYDPKAGRSDEFDLENGSQAAVGLAPAVARKYLDALSQADDAAGVNFRLPDEAEWLVAARAGRPSGFWWGDAATFPNGANFLGPEPALRSDSTAPTRLAGFRPNPWRLFHTFGNVDEWARRSDGSAVRMGGHFRTDPAHRAEPFATEDPLQIGPDSYVGIRPAFDLSAASGAAIARNLLGPDPAWKAIQVEYDPDRAQLTLSGPVESSARRARADRLLAPLWFAAGLENQLAPPGVGGELARLGPVVGASQSTTTLGRVIEEVLVAVLWSPQLPVDGSEWRVNIYGPGGTHSSYAITPPSGKPKSTLRVAVDRSRISGPLESLQVALSLGGEAPRPDAANRVSNLAGLGR